jgi:hypothetical protein
MHFCDFSNVPGFPNPMPDKDKWEICLPKFKGEDWEVPAEFLLDFHECMHQLDIFHEYVLVFPRGKFLRMV